MGRHTDGCRDGRSPALGGDEAGRRRTSPESDSGAGPWRSAPAGRQRGVLLLYFNLEWPEGAATPVGAYTNIVRLESTGEGVIVAVGWPGQWAARFTADGEGRVRARAGQELTHFLLHPGEEVRSPLIAMQFWKGDRIRAQNLWRRWMLAHSAPKLRGNPLTPLSGAFDGYYGPFQKNCISDFAVNA
jgi:hypothetical protein